jgi:hypothetical protein
LISIKSANNKNSIAKFETSHFFNTRLKFHEKGKFCPKNVTESLKDDDPNVNVSGDVADSVSSPKIAIVTESVKADQPKVSGDVGDGVSANCNKRR